jgi:4'-phosphopantetheinyl transferase EntD
VLERLLPHPVRSAEIIGETPLEPCFPGEEHLVETVAPGRRHEVITARRCARQALADLGHPPAPIGRGPKREPLWPPGIAGSITHCTGYRGAAVVPAGEITGIGIDAEPHAALPPRVLGAVTTPADRETLARLAVTHPEVCWDRLLFSAKESIYKAWFPLTGRWLGFDDASLDIDPEEQSFTGRILLDDAPITRIHGRYLAEQGLIITAVHV